LLRADVTTDAGLHRLIGAIRRHDATAFLFSLGLTCLTDWRAVFAAVYEAAPVGARFSILDVHSPQLTPGARFLNWIGRADVRRPVWEELEQRGWDLRKETRRPFGVFGIEVLDASVVVASGRKPAR
jgi:hypothetical protein